MNVAELQRQLTDHIRDPQHYSGPAGVEDRRLKIYRELFFRNIESFIAGNFPVLRRLYGDDDWLALVREFMRNHRAQTPYFLEIGREFIEFLQSRSASPADPPFLQELAHYEWVELALDVDDTDLGAIAADRNGDLLQQPPVLSPLAWCMGYQFPVHRIGPGFRPLQPETQPTLLVVYRDRTDKVGFMEVNPVTMRLLELLQASDSRPGKIVLAQLAGELAMPAEQVLRFGRGVLYRMRDADILLGTRLS